MRLPQPDLLGFDCGSSLYLHFDNLFPRAIFGSTINLLPILKNVDELKNTSLRVIIGLFDKIHGT